jgi:RNA polymerase sigma-70 factor (ECF subfamily)
METLNKKERFTDIYNKEVDAVFRYCRSRVNDRDKAVEITQDVFTELCVKYSKDEAVEHERAFLFTLAHNKIVDWYRRKKSLSLDEMMNDDGEHFFEPADEKAGTDIVLGAEAGRIIEAINALDPSYREAVYLRFVEDLPPQEIAKILGTTASITSVRITRGLEKLKEKFN